MRGLEGDAKKAGDGAQKTERGIKDLAVSLGLVKIGAAAFKVLAASMDTAIKRFDTLNTFPKVLQALGVSAEDSERAIAKLSDGIDGLPTKLDDIASTAQRMYNSFNDIDKATDSALALNNALLASGANANEAQRGTDQYIKALQTGKMDMQTWTTLQQTMGIGLTKVAEAFNMTEQEMYSALQSGQISMGDFNDKMIELGTGTGILAKLAKENSLGIETSLGNLRNAAARGIADIIGSFDKLSKAVTGKDIAQNIDGMKVVVNTAFKAIGGAIEATIPIVILFADGVKMIIPVVEALSPLIIGLATGYAALAVIDKINSIIDKNAAVLQAAAFSGKELTIALTAKKKAVAADTAAQATNTSTISLAQAAVGVLTGNIKLSTVATTLFTQATAALKAVLNPTAIAIGLVVTAGIALVKWFTRSTEEGSKLTAQTDALSEASEELTSSVEQNSAAYESSISGIESSAAANEDLVDKIHELSEAEHKSATEKELLGDYIEQLNGQVEGLNLAYDAEADAMNMSSEQIANRIELMKEQEAATAGQERLLEISKEQNEVEQKLEETNQLRADWNQKIEEGTVGTWEYAKAVDELDEQEEELKATLGELGEQYGLTEAQMIEAMENQHAIAQETIEGQIILYDQLSESQQATVDSMSEAYESLQEAATDAFDKIETKTDHTMESMTETLQHNQEVVAEWGENQAQIMEWAGENGYENLVPYVESMGIDSAAELAVLANASDEEMIKFAESLETGAETGTDAFVQGIMDGDEEAYGAVEHLVGETEGSLREQIEAADFASIGEDVGDGMAKGVEQGSEKAANASGDMADDMIDTTQQTLQTHSPSVVFKNIGTDVTDGLALGINDGTNKVTQALGDLFKAMQTDTTRSFDELVKNMENSVKQMGQALDELAPLTQKAMQSMLNVLRTGSSQQIDLMRNTSTQLIAPFNNTPTHFRSVGINSMNGLNAGLNAGRGRVLSTARGIANSVASTMRSALKIHSPSRVMKDDVGRWVPEGLAEGIESNTDSVFNALDKMTGGMMKMTSPEVALGIAGGGAMAGTHNRTINNSPQTSNVDNRNFTFNANANGTERNEREFYQRLFREFKWYIQQEGGAFN